MITEDWEKEGAQRWSPADVREEVPVHSGRAPRMAYMPWSRVSRGVEMGMATPDESYWRCRETGCRRFGGPYINAMSASDDGHEHARLPHPERQRTQSKGRSR